MNLVTLMGRLTRDPELKYSQSGKAFTKFSIAVTREFNRDEADFINCIAWDKRAETICEYLRKGRRIALQGRLSVRNYEKDGETKWITEVIVDKFDFIDYQKSDTEENDNYEHNDAPESDPEEFPF
ncbi:Helix-destabilizing protein [Sebaldella termitidis]|uniref:Single-stranded DNA-binding protein n=1 Tax=Sebaldella termitidis (strain ATCC 33386 / NCTC 11300) TaxID=526218 RepID=D1ANB3_SEBTE|nr:single-stranded DNA-binding protein [Sebaldella termitidis]ACZ07685.1 single-strand binding protein [Sebaldella termitidis ATCC 33386]ACZ09717.1 single-strand binding protein [Sebaldella termitidis ATCC 33386]SUI22981.1 Helix-destabilizing protein [Sebaldella termitidis]SUI25048.1 Helix-destabilizing protein [Sebaldella termitidis]